jgi:flagellin-like hook-associated protein FlgL
LSEIDRVASQTQFNGLKVLNSAGTISIQVGANDGEKSTLLSATKLTGAFWLRVLLAWQAGCCCF